MSKFKPTSLVFLMVILFPFTASVGTKYISSASFMTANAQDTSCPSPDDLVPQLAVDIWARVGSGLTHNVRETASTQAAIVAQVPDGDIFRVIGGPICAESFVWWQVDYAGTQGWMAEGDPKTGQYWLTVLDGQNSPTPEPENGLKTSGCQKPPEDYKRVLVNGEQLNDRTLAMLDYAQELYSADSGVIHFRTSIMQGSYNPGGVAASFGTHDGGGAVDISVRDPQNHQILTAAIAPMLRALRFAGFAAWLRDTDVLYKGSPIHIHAIAIGDAELSDAARAQIDGTFGYLRGYDGLPRDDGIPQPDKSGDMIVCQWMVEMGFHDLRPTAGQGNG
ncbi:MAG: SH3 domain-containing protein [Chloroflexota bacterium]